MALYDSPTDGQPDTYPMRFFHDKRFGQSRSQFRRQPRAAALNAQLDHASRLVFRGGDRDLLHLVGVNVGSWKNVFTSVMQVLFSALQLGRRYVGDCHHGWYLVVLALNLIAPSFGQPTK